MIRETLPEDLSHIEVWLSNPNNRMAHTGTDFQWSDFDDVEQAELSPTLAKHVRSHTLVAEGTAVGIVVTYPTFDYPWVWHLEVFVDPLERSAGYGLELLTFAIDDLFQNTFCTVLEGTIAEDNQASLAAFCKFGDVIVGRIDNYFMRRDSAKVAAIRVAMTKEQWNARV
ncbi:N-acetyltransferase family protein [Corynebacterium sp. 20_84]